MPEPWVETLRTGSVIEARFSEVTAGDVSSVRVRRCGGSTSPDDERLVHGPRGRRTTLRIAGLTAGCWVLEVARGQLVGTRVEVSALGENEVRRVDIPPAPATATITGTALWNGRPTSFRLVAVGDGEPNTSVGHAFIQPSGRFTCETLPGRYRPVRDHGMGGSGTLPFADDLIAVAGQQDVGVLHLRTRAVRVRMLRAGLPAAGVRVHAVAAERFVLAFAPTDSHGGAEFALPLGSLPLFAEPAGGGERVSLGSVDVIAGEGPQVVVFDLPP